MHHHHPHSHQHQQHYALRPSAVMTRSQAYVHRAHTQPQQQQQPTSGPPPGFHESTRVPALSQTGRSTRFSHNHMQLQQQQQHALLPSLPPLPPLPPGQSITFTSTPQQWEAAQARAQDAIQGRTQDATQLMARELRDFDAECPSLLTLAEVARSQLDKSSDATETGADEPLASPAAAPTSGALNENENRLALSPLVLPNADQTQSSSSFSSSSSINHAPVLQHIQQHASQWPQQHATSTARVLSHVPPPPPPPQPATTIAAPQAPPLSVWEAQLDVCNRHTAMISAEIEKLHGVWNHLYRHWWAMCQVPPSHPLSGSIASTFSMMVARMQRFEMLMDQKMALLQQWEMIRCSCVSSWCSQQLVSAPPRAPASSASTAPAVPAVPVVPLLSST